MRRRLAAALCLAVCLGSTAEAQTSTDEGVDAFVRGDYQRAADILKPIAEAWPPRDSTAAFFMGLLYQRGFGVPQDFMRACELFVRAEVSPGDFLSRWTSAAVQSIHDALPPHGFETCVRMAPVGFDHGFQPATFALEPGQWIDLDIDSATVTYRGKQTRTELPVPPGVVFLPLEHTEVTTADGRRHFIQISSWIPAEAGRYSLLWSLFEVVREELIAITTEELLTVSGERSALDRSFDVHAVARVRADQHGGAEWAVIKGPNPRSSVIEPDADRRERVERDAARRAADARVDWTRVRDVATEPQFAYVDANGCGNAFVYAWTADRTEAVAIRADADALGLSATQRTFDLASNLSGLQVSIRVFGRPQRQWPFCTDVIAYDDTPTETWTAVAGVVTIQLTPHGRSPSGQRVFHATVQIAGAEFVNSKGARVRQVRPVTLTARVASMFG